MNNIAVGWYEDPEEQRVIFESLKNTPRYASTPHAKDPDQHQLKLDALQKWIRELEDANRTLVLQSHRSSNDKGNPTTVKPNIPTKVDEVQKTHETLNKPVLQLTKAPLKPMLHSEGLPGPNTKRMVESISSKIGKGPIPEKSESIPMRPIHQVPIQSAIGKAIEELGNVS